MKEIRLCPICDGKVFTPFLTSKDYTVSKEDFTIIQCAECKFLVTSPTPDSDKLGNYYLSETYISHAKKGSTMLDKIYIMARTFTLHWKTKLLNKATIHTAQVKLLDYGCGTGEFLKTCKSRGWSISGIEPSDKARKYSTEATGVAIHKSFEDISNEEFNIITLWHVLEHIEDLNETLEKLKSRLSNFGTIFIAVPNHKSWDGKYYSQCWAGYDVPRHLWHFTQDTMEKLLQKHQLKLIKKVPMKLDAFYVSILSEKYKNPGKSLLTNLLNATINGLRSNSHARKNKEYSSLIYIVRK